MNLEGESGSEDADNFRPRRTLTDGDTDEIDQRAPPARPVPTRRIILRRAPPPLLDADEDDEEDATVRPTRSSTRPKPKPRVGPIPTPARAQPVRSTRAKIVPSTASSKKRSRAKNASSSSEEDEEDPLTDEDEEQDDVNIVKPARRPVKSVVSTVNTASGGGERRSLRSRTQKTAEELRLEKEREIAEREAMGLAEEDEPMTDSGEEME